FERVHIDLVGPLANSKGYRYILVMVDAFTKWVEAIPLRDKSAETVAWAVLTTWVTRYGWMDRIHSDQGTEFENQVMHGLCDWAGTIKTRTTPYHPQGNGAVERVNRTIREAVTAICEEFGTKWTDALPFALWSMRSAVSRTTGSTPYYLLFGREMRLPFDYLRTDDRGERLYAEYVEELIENLEQIRTTAVKHIERSQERTRLLFDETALLRTFQTGQSVLIRRKVRPSDEAPGEKFWLRWEGPFTVEFQRKWTVHVNDMKSFRNANVPAPPTPFPAAKTTTPQPATSSTPRRSARLARQASTEQRGAMKLRSGKKVPGPTNVNSVPAEECDADVLELVEMLTAVHPTSRMSVIHAQLGFSGNTQSVDAPTNLEYDRKSDPNASLPRAPPGPVIRNSHTSTRMRGPETHRTDSPPTHFRGEAAKKTSEPIGTE
ncbi:MAG: putative integrase core domain protein, partial [Rhodocyclaceae bacterium]